MSTPDDSAVRAALARDDYLEAERLGEFLDSPPKTFSLPNVALWYAEHGLRVFPLQEGSKVPRRGSRGCLDASSDPTRIRAWWARDPRANIGLATGHLVDVIDVDGPDGVLSWARLEHLPETIGAVSTPRDGGTHLYVRATGAGNRAKIAPGVDYRGLGGYVVAPPSVNADGVPYRWRRPLDLAAIRQDGAPAS